MNQTTTPNAGSATGIDLAALEQLARGPMCATTAIKAEQALKDFHDGANPATVLALIAALARATPQHHEAPQHSVTEQAGDLNERYDAMLRALCCDFGVGGYNSEGLIDPAIADAKIRSAIDEQRRVAADMATRAQPLASTAATQPEQASIKTWQERCGDTGPMPSLDQAASAMKAEIADLRAALAIPASTAASEQQAGADELPPLPAQHDELRARWKCEDCAGTGEVGELIDQGYFQPPERARCSTCDGAGQVSIVAYTDDQMHDYARAALTHRATTADQQGDTESAYQRGYMDGMAKGRRDAVEDAQQGDTASASFADWLAREMPAGTVISDPAWWAPRILRAAGAQQGAAQAQAGDLGSDHA